MLTKKTIRSAPLGLLLLAALAAAGCAALPRAQSLRDAPEELAVPPRFAADDRGQEAAAEDALAGELLSLFGDARLQALVERGLAGNLDIMAAESRLSEAAHAAGIARGALWPSVGARLGGQRDKAAAGTGTAYDAGVDVSWEVDLWGRLRSERDAAELGFEATRDELQAARDSLSAQLMQAWFDAVTARELEVLESQRLVTLQMTEDSIRRRFISGLGTLADLDTARTSTELARRGLAAARQSHADARRALQLLLGAYPDASLLAEGGLPALREAPPEGLPATLLTRRPDLRAAFAQVRAADARVKAAHRALYPTLVLTGSGGRVSESLGDLGSAPNVWSLASRLSAPIFQGGRLERAMRVADEQARQAWIAYLRVALVAFGEAEGALERESSLAAQEGALERALEHAQRSEVEFRERYESGLATILDRLDTERAVFDARASLLAVRCERLKNRVTLGLALGMGV